MVPGAFLLRTRKEIIAILYDHTLFKHEIDSIWNKLLKFINKYMYNYVMMPP